MAGTALLQSSMLGEIARLCSDHLRSTTSDHLRSTTIGPSPRGTTFARGPKTEAVAERDGCHITITWIRRGTEYRARIYEPLMMDVTPALADILALLVE